MTEEARAILEQFEVRKSMRIDYFENDNLLK